MRRFRPRDLPGILEVAASNTLFARNRWTSPRISKSRAACLGLASVVLTGCAAKVHLDKVPIASMQINLPKGSRIAPGESLPLVVLLTEPNGSALLTEGTGRGKVRWKDLKVTATVATVNKKGIVSLPQDPRISDRKLPHVTITVPSHPGIQADLDIPVRYDYGYTAYFSGISGANGNNGIDGVDGGSGAMGSIDSDHPAPGGDGGNGTNGTDGQSGGPGSDGPPVQIRVGIREGEYALLQVDVTTSTEGYERLFMIDPQEGTLTVSTLGGDGGKGGKGAAEAVRAPGESERPMDTMEAAAPMEGTLRMGRQEEEDSFS
jgi:hypothetical protein